MNSFLLNPKLSLVEVEKAGDVIDHFDHPIDIKDAHTKKYIYNNSAASTSSGLLKEERVGMDVRDIARINHIKDTAINKIVQADHQVITTKLPATLHHVFLNKEGILLVDHVIKKPLLGQTGEPVAILSYAHTVTQYIDLSQLYQFYRIYYRKKEAVQRFLKHLQLEKVFVEPPTDQELRTLLAIQSSVSSSKYVAKLMRLSPRTIEEYKSRLRGKLKFISFEKLLSILRVYGRYEETT